MKQETFGSSFSLIDLAFHDDKYWEVYKRMNIIKIQPKKPHKGGGMKSNHMTNRLYGKRLTSE